MSFQIVLQHILTNSFNPATREEGNITALWFRKRSLEKHGLLFKCICWLTAAILNCELWHLQILRVLRSNIDGNWRAGTDSDEYKSLSKFNVSSICSNSHPVYKKIQFLYRKHDGFLQWHDNIDLGPGQRAERYPWQSSVFSWVIKLVQVLKCKDFEPRFTRRFR